MYIRGTNSSRAKKSNHTAILRLIQQYGPIKRSDITQMLELTLPTITTSVNKMIDAGLVRESTTSVESEGAGRKAHMVDLVPNYGKFMGIEIRGSRRTICISDFRGNLLFSEIDTSPCSDYDKAMDSVAALYHKILESSKLRPGKITRVGLVSPGLIDSEKGILRMHPGYNWFDKEICSDFCEKTGYHGPVYTMNNSCSRAISAQLFNRDLIKESSVFAYMFIADGIACPLLLNSNMMKDALIGKGEIGHMVMHENGPLCSCGNRGCLEAYASDASIISACQEALKNGEAPILAELLGDDELTVELIMKAKKKKDPFATETVNRAITTLGIALANITNFSSPDAILIEGRLFADSDNQKLLNRTITQNLYGMYRTKTAYHFVKADNLSGALSAAAIAIFDEIENFSEQF